MNTSKDSVLQRDAPSEKDHSAVRGTNIAADCRQTPVYIQSTKWMNDDGRIATAFGGTNPSSECPRCAPWDGACGRLAQVFIPLA